MRSEDFFAKISDQYSEKLPFVVYRKPNDKLLKGILQKDTTLHFVKDYTENGFVFAPFDEHNDCVLMPLLVCESIEANIEKMETINSSCIENQQEDYNIVSQSKENHIRLVETAIDAIMNHQFQKVVLSRKEVVRMSRVNLINIFRNLLNTYDSAFAYCWFHPKVGLWLGATPETFLNIEGHQLKTMALAGTQKYNGTLDVLWEQKEKEEQQIVTDFIVEGLQPSVDAIKVSRPETVRAGNLLHLKTSIEAKFKPGTLDLNQLLKSIHPTPAVCGLPKDKAEQFILKSENYKREYYTGFLGELNFKAHKSRNSNRQNIENNAYASIKKVSNLYVNLRCMQLIGNEAFVYVGGGVTKDSIPESEWEETVSKSQVIKSVL